ncbi:hypothetical protein C900_03699 [Fulvivirga imtechensis AK7]|uniref:Uncharacterized protein n=1 Tax=Fulvivirga imtechensis AK7 TaxID=1237149 RepID=L8JNM4_9BACT|nr:hypothetical protein C900_03699 [Fulvivirga imtechensis AK7]
MTTSHSLIIPGFGFEILSNNNGAQEKYRSNNKYGVDVYYFVAHKYETYNNPHCQRSDQIQRNYPVR